MIGEDKYLVGMDVSDNKVDFSAYVVYKVIGLGKATIVEDGVIPYIENPNERSEQIEALKNKLQNKYINITFL